MPQTILSTPIGPILLAAEDDRLTWVGIGAAGTTDDRLADAPLLKEAVRQLLAYFDGRLTCFDLPLTEPTSPRGRDHRQAIADIPYGETASYGALARQIGSGPRAIGQACRRNPFPIVIPCHRVIGAGGAIGYYTAGEGVTTKRWLLDHERRKGPHHG